MPKEDESRHRKRFVDSTYQCRKCAPSIPSGRQFDGEEKIGLYLGGMKRGGIIEHIAMHTNLCIGELKKKV